MKYPKMQTYWKRTERGKIIPNEYSKVEFKNIKLWRVTEKIDGMNTRIMLRNGVLTLGTRKHDENSNKFNIPKELTAYLRDTFNVDKMNEYFRDKNVTIFGEGYGQKIQSGGNYRSDQSFILFDIIIHEIDHNWWMERGPLIGFAKEFDIKIVPIWDTLVDFETIENFVKSKPESVTAERSMITEGVIAKTEPLMFFRNGDPIMFKLKVRDYDK